MNRRRMGTKCLVVEDAGFDALIPYAYTPDRPAVIFVVTY